MDFKHHGNDYTRNAVHGGRVQFGDSYNFNQESEASKQESLRTEALRALYWTDPEVDLTKAEDRTRAGRTPGTCEWVLENEDFKAWQEAEAPQLLLITGEPGIGKTVLATFLVDHFRKESASNGSDFSYFFCMNAEARQSTGLGILRGLLWLLLRNKPALCDHLLKKFAMKGEQLFDSIESLWPVFEAVVTDDNLGSLLLQIDGLDECEEASRDFLVSRLGGLMRRGSGLKMKVVVTSRVIRTANDLASYYPGATKRITMDVGKVNKDLQRFIEYEVDDIAAQCRWDADLKAEVTEQVKNRDGGTFVWISLALKTVSRKRPYQVIDELSKLPLGLQDLYARILYEIPEDDRDIVCRVLVLVIGADMPMSLDELSIALHFYPDQSGSRAARRRLPTVKEMDHGKQCVQACAILLRVTEDIDERIVVNLFHLTLKEFLTGQQLPPDVSNYHVDQRQANNILSKISTAYLSSEELDAIAADAEKLRDMAIGRYGYRKAVSRPPETSLQHEENVPRKKILQHFMGKLLRRSKGRQEEEGGKGQKEEAIEQEEKHMLFELCKDWSEVEDRHLTLLDLAVRIQWERNEATTIKKMQPLFSDPMQGNQVGYTEEDFVFVLRLMIEDSSLAATRAMCVMWHFVRVSNTAPVFSDKSAFKFPESIAMAARSGRSDMLEAFVRLSPLDYLEPRIIFAMTLQTFVPDGKPPIQRDQDAFDLLFSAARLACIPDGSSLLHAAAAICCSYLVRRCIESGDIVYSRDALGWTPLHQLATWNWDESEAILCAHLILDADPERAGLRSIDHMKQLPLHNAAALGSLKLLQLFIDARTTPDRALFIAQDEFDQVPLHLALDGYHHRTDCSLSHCVAALLRADHEKKSLHIAEGRGILPLHVAAYRACLDCAKLLVEADVTRSTLLVQDRWKRKPVDCAQDVHKFNQEEHSEDVERSLELVEYLSKLTAAAQGIQQAGPQSVDSETESTS